MCVPVQVSEQLGNGPASCGVNSSGCNFQQGLQYETTNGHPRMRDGQLGSLHDPIVEEEEIEVESALAPADAPDPTITGLDLLQQVQQRRRLQRRLDAGRGVEKTALPLGTADRLGFMERANIHDGDAGTGVQLLDGTQERGPAVSEIAAQADQREEVHGAERSSKGKLADAIDG